MANLVIDLTNEGYGPVPVGHMNNDCLENAHSCLRGALGHCQNPSAQEYPGAFCTCVINFMTNKIKGKNCRDDNALNLISLTTLISIADEEARAKRRSPPEVQLSLPLPISTAAGSNEALEEEDADEPDEEEADEDEEPDALPPLSADEDFLQRLKAKMAAAQSSNIAIPIIETFLKQVVMNALRSSWESPDFLSTSFTPCQHQHPQCHHNSHQKLFAA
jgi:hypothetical protein